MLGLTIQVKLETRKQGPALYNQMAIQYAIGSLLQ